MYQTESAGSGMMDGTTEAQLQSLGRPLLCQFSPANTVHFPLLFLIPLISGCTVFYNYLLSPPPHPINGPSLENMSYISKAQQKLLFRFRAYSQQQSSATRSGLEQMGAGGLACHGLGLGLGLHLL